MTKKNILIGSGSGVVILLLWNYIGNYHICDFVTQNGSAGDCPLLLTSMGINFLPIFPLFLFSLIAYFMREEIFRAWVRFATWWIPISMFCILITPTDYGGAGIGMSLGKPDVALVTSFFFVLISLILIAYKFFKLKKSGAGK